MISLLEKPYKKDSKKIIFALYSILPLSNTTIEKKRNITVKQ